MDGHGLGSVDVGMRAQVADLGAEEIEGLGALGGGARAVGVGDGEEDVGVPGHADAVGEGGARLGGGRWGG